MKKKNKTIYLTLVGDNFNLGHANIINNAKKYGKIIIGIMTDSACVEYTSLPHFSYEYRKNLILKSCRNIYKINLNQIM